MKIWNNDLLMGLYWAEAPSSHCETVKALYNVPSQSSQIRIIMVTGRGGSLAEAGSETITSTQQHENMMCPLA